MPKPRHSTPEPAEFDDGDDALNDATVEPEGLEPAWLEPDRPSKTARKRAAHDLQDLGDALAALPADRLAAIPMDDTLRAALEELRRVRSHEGRRRHRQYVGKLMRLQDEEPLREALAAAQVGSARETLRLHELEALRLDLSQRDEALTEFLRTHPQADAQQLRTLIRNARKEAQLPPEQRHGRAWRELFQCLKGLTA